MKVLEYTYKHHSESRKIAFQNDEDGDKLLKDIITARDSKINTVMVISGGRTLVISPCDILEMVLTETNELENT